MTDTCRFVRPDSAEPVILPPVVKISQSVCGDVLERERGARCVVVPHCVEVIASGAFAGFGALEEVAFARGSRLREVGPGAFRGCERLADIRFPEGVRGAEAARE